MSPKNKALIQTMLASGLAVLLSYLINFFLTPYITDTVGTEAYGFVTFSKTMVGYFSIFTVAFTAFIVRYITLAHHEKKMDEAIGYYASSVATVVIISLVIVALTLVFVVFMPYLIAVPAELLTSVRILVILVVVNFCITTITVPFTATFYINNNLSLYNIFKTLSYVVDAAVLIVMFSVFPVRIWYVGAAMVGAALTIFIGSYIVSKKKNAYLKFDRSMVSMQKVITMGKNGIWQSINSIGTTLNHGLDLLVTNQMLSSLVMGQLSITKNICMIFSVMYSTISQAFQPRMLKAYASSDMKLFMGELKLAMRVSGFFSACTFAGFFALGDLYYKLWIPNQDYHFLYVLTVVSVFSGLGEGIIYPAYYVNTLTTKKMMPCIVTVSCGLLNVLGMYVLIRFTNLGVYAVILTTVVLTFLNCIGFSAIYCPWTLKLPWYTLYPVIIRHLIAAALMCGVFFVIAKITAPTSWFGLILSAIVMVCFGTVLYVAVVTSAKEKKNILEKITKKLRGKGV